MSYQTKDFIETTEGLIFAIVESDLEHNTVLCFLRYVNHQGQWQKQSTQQANQLLTEKYPQYLYYSAIKDAHLHGVKTTAIIKHHRAQQRLTLLQQQTQLDVIEKDLFTLAQLFGQQGLAKNHIGVTGSLLIGAQNSQSDIDLVFYQPSHFQQARQIIQRLIITKDFQALSHTDWQESFQRRDCELTLNEYIWHEQRKQNKALFNGRKFDISLLSKSLALPTAKKIGSQQITAQVIDDSQVFCYPAVFKIQHPHIKNIICYTATYSGQAFKGEWIEACGLTEQLNNGEQHLMVGSSREANGEYIKVITTK